MKHLIVTRTLSNRGGQIVLTSLARELLKQGVKLEMVGFKPEGTEDFPDCEPLYRGLPIDVIPVPVKDEEPLQARTYVDATTKVLRQRQGSYDTIILDSWFTALAGILAQVDRTKTFQLVQSDPVFAPSDGSKTWEACVFEMLPYYPMQRIVVSKSTQSLFAERYGQEYPRIDLYVDDQYREAAFKVLDRSTLRFVSSASDFTIPTKGLATLLSVLDGYTDRPFELTLISGKPVPAELIGRHAYPIHTAYAATPATMIDILQKQDVYINTSTKETFGLALAEAVTLGMPAVALDSVGNRDYARGDNFILVRDSADLLESLRQLSSVEVRREFHRHAKDSMAHYTLKSMTKQFRDITGI